MSSGQHLSKELYDLIKSIGETRSKQEEDKIITHEVGVLKTQLGAKGIVPKKMKEYLIRAIYIEMLGHDASFAHIHAINLTQDKNLAIKRMGYLACTLFLNEKSELLILLVANLQRDLQSSSPFETLVALNTLCKLICPTIAHGFVDPILKHLNHSHELIRKKSIMVLQKLLKLCPQNIPDTFQKLRKCLCDKDPSVMGATLNVYYERVQENPQKFKEMVNDFVIILKQVIDHKLTRDFDYHRMPAPWIQIKLLQILAMLGANDKKTSESIYELLSMTLKRADDTGINIGYAITYQCVKTIASIYPYPPLLDVAANAVKRFISSESNNLKFLGINALISLVQVNPKAAIEHQLTVVECLESRDETLKFQTLELVFRMANPQNVEIIVDKLITQLKISTDDHFKKDIVNKIYTVCEKYAPSSEWFVSKTINLIEMGAEFIEKSIVINIIKLIEENYELNGNEFGSFVINYFLELLSRDYLHDHLIKILSWVIGEIGSSMYADDENSLEQLAYALISTLNQAIEDSTTIGYILTALHKIASTNGFQAFHIIEPILEKYSTSQVFEIQQRCCEAKIAKQSLYLLKGSSKVVVDPDLSFLNNFVSAAVQKGSKPYDESKARKILFGMSNTQVNQKGALNFTPYAKTTPPISKKIGDSTEVLRSVGRPAFEKKDIKKIDHAQPIKLVTTGNKPIEKKKIEDPKAKEKLKLAESLFGTSELTFKPNKNLQLAFDKNQNSHPSNTQNQGSPSKSGGFQLKVPTPNNVQVQKPNPTKAESSGQDLLNLDFSPPSLFPQPQTIKSQKENPPSAISHQNDNNLDLLGMDFSESNTSKTQTQNNKAIVNENKSARGLDNQGKHIGNTGGNMFIGMTPGIMQTQPTSPSLILEPLQMSVQDYENSWNSLPIEKKEIIRYEWLKTDTDFRLLCNKISFYVISVVSNEGICSAKINNQIYLLYGVYDSNGNLTAVFKGADANILSQLIQNLKTLCL